MAGLENSVMLSLLAIKLIAAMATVRKSLSNFFFYKWNSSCHCHFYILSFWKACWRNLLEISPAFAMISSSANFASPLTVARPATTAWTRAAAATRMRSPSASASWDSRVKSAKRKLNLRRSKTTLLIILFKKVLLLQKQFYRAYYTTKFVQYIF